MGLRGGSPRWWRGASPLLALALVLAAAAVSRAADYDGEPPDYGPPPPGSYLDEDGGGSGRSTWEPDTSLTFHRYLDPFPRVDSARACRNRCANTRYCTGWTYYDANFNDAGRFSYKLQRLCVLGSGLKNRQVGNRPGRISGVLSRQEGPRGSGGGGD